MNFFMRESGGFGTCQQAPSSKAVFPLFLLSPLTPPALRSQTPVPGVGVTEYGDSRIFRRVNRSMQFVFYQEEICISCRLKWPTESLRPVPGLLVDDG